MDITFLFVSEWVIRFILLFYLTRKRSPEQAIAWLLIIFFEPWIGLGLYLLFGMRIPSEKRLKPYWQLAEHIEKSAAQIVPDIAKYVADLPKSERGLAHLVREMGRFPALAGNNIELFSQSADFIERLVEDIRHAQHHVHLEFYIYRDDDVGLRVLRALEDAVSRGVTCRLMVDAVGSRHFFRKQGHRVRHAGIELVDAAPVISLRRYLGRIDWRNHRKIVVIDGKIGYTGSQNISHPSYGHADLKWKDLMVRLTGPAVLELQAVFISDWALEANENLVSFDVFPQQEEQGTDCVQVLPSGPIYQTENYQRLVISAIYSAKKTITITTPYFIPDNVFLQAVEVACLRGVEVNILVPMKTDHSIADKASQSYYEDLLRWGVHIYRYTKGVLHPKTMTVDDNIAFFGSSNFDIRSFVLDFEINMIFYGRHEAALIRKQQEKYIADSILLLKDEWMQRKKMLPIIENIAKLFSPLL